MTDSPTEPYALLRRDGAKLDVPTLARVLAPLLGCVRADLQVQLAERPGVLVSGVPRDVALDAVAALAEAGVGVWALPQSDVVVPPPPIDVRRGKVTEEGFLFDEAGTSKLAPWKEIVYFDAIQVQTAENVVVTQRQWDTSEDDGGAFRDVNCLRLVTGWQELLDVVCYEPWVHLRIDKTQFRYPGAGLVLHGNTMKNFLTLLIAFKTHCDATAEGPGIGLYFDGRPETRQRVPNRKIYDNLFRWRLTLRFRVEGDWRQRSIIQ